jgi:NAD+ synthase
MVIGTSNKTEIMTGFFTKYGDGGVDLLPLGDLYKTQVRQIAKHLKVPDNIITKPPSPGFFPGQTDEAELGIDYTTLDIILYSMEKGMSIKEIAEDLGLSFERVKAIQTRIMANEHKRRPPLILRLT